MGDKSPEREQDKTGRGGNTERNAQRRQQNTECSKHLEQTDDAKRTHRIAQVCARLDHFWVPQQFRHAVRNEHQRDQNRQRNCGDPHNSAPRRHRVGQNTDAFDFDLDDIAGNEESFREEAGARRRASADDVAGLQYVESR